MSLENDPRWRRFNGRSTPCPCCGRSFAGVFDIAFDHPDPWPHGNRGDRARVEVGEDVLTADLCRIGGQGFVRCLLTFPIIGTDQTFAFGVWGSLSEASFGRYLGAMAPDAASGFDGCFTWLANMLPVFAPQEPVPCDLVVRSAGRRPECRAHTGDNPVWRHQRDGIHFDLLLDIYEATGIDVRRHLADA